MAHELDNFTGLNELALFAGAGGGILGGHLLGWRTVCAVEWNPYAASVLVARQNDGILPPFPIWDDVQTFDGRPWRGRCDVVSGGFPCQDISCAGKGAGIAGERSGMWKEMARIIGEVRPRYAFIENSPMLVTRGLDVVLCDLAAMGFNAEWGVISAADCGAPHKRDRIWIVAYTESWQSRQSPERKGREGFSRRSGNICRDTPTEHDTRQPDILSHSEHERTGRREQQQESTEEAFGEMANTNSFRQASTKDNTTNNFKRKKPANEYAARCGTVQRNIPYTTSIGQSGQRESINPVHCAEKREREANNVEPMRINREWPTEPDICRVVNGMAARMDRLTALGNGQVPRVAATAFTILKDRKN